MKKVIKAYARKYALVLLVAAMGSCSVHKLSSQDGYNEAWQKVLQSKAWKDGLESDETRSMVEEQDFYASTEDVVRTENDLSTKPDSDPNFDAKYDILVRRAYLKIIAQAEKADTRLEREYILRNAAALKKGEKRTKEFNQKLELINKRYQAHRSMLEGLKSWNIFSEYGTNDLDFFKAENQKVVQEMVRKGKKESTIVNYLIYKLADLYHFEE